jgi:SAM-dependent methyltransferase
MLRVYRAAVPLERRDLLRKQVARLRRPAWLGTIRRTTPLSRIWGHDRGQPLDRLYIEDFLQAHRADVHGRVLEVRDNGYTRRFGTGVTRSDVLDVDPTNADATVIIDLMAADALAPNAFDCFILTQTLQYLPDLNAVLLHARRILRPGGVLLATLPAIAPIDLQARGPDYWRFTAASCSLLFGSVFGSERVLVQPYGNVLTAIASLLGMAREELTARELTVGDDAFPVILGVRAVKVEA